MRIRAYTTEDFETINSWAKARGGNLVPHLIGNRGFLVEDEQGPCGVAFVYLMFEVPIATVDNFVTRPGQGMRKSLDIWAKIWRAIQDYLPELKDCNGQPLGYKTVRTFVRSPLAKYCKVNGWKVSDTQSTQITYEIP